MRRSAKWMVLLDERIMELIEEEGPLTPSKIADDKRIDYGTQYVGDRCRKLADEGLLINLGNGVYTLSDEGLGYIEKRYDVSRGVWLDNNQPENGQVGPDAGTEGAGNGA